MKDMLYRQVGVVASTIIVFAVNMAAVFLPLNGLTTQELSDKNFTYFTPAGYVFSIWSLIYLALFAYAIYQALPRHRHVKSFYEVAPWYILSSVANVVWIFLWHYEYVQLSVVAMLVLLVSLVKIYKVLHIGEWRVSQISHYAVHIPFSLYLGWISVATIANVAVVLKDMGWSGFGLSDTVWTAIMMSVAVGLGFIMLWKKMDIVFALVIMWALSGIITASGAVQLISFVGWAGIVVLLLGILYTGYKNITHPEDDHPVSIRYYYISVFRR